MIAVQANAKQHDLVCELFQLFKTPWTFFKNENNYDVLICFDGEIRDCNAKLILVFSSVPIEFDNIQGFKTISLNSPIMTTFSGKLLPIYGKCIAFPMAVGSVILSSSGKQQISISMETRGKTIIRLGFDLLYEVQFLLTNGQPPGNAYLPTLEHHIALLRQLILDSGIPLIEIPPVPYGYRFLACLTHDVDHVGIRNHRWDHTMFGFLYRATIGSFLDFIRKRKSARQLLRNWSAAAKLPLVHLGLAKDFWFQFEQYRKLEGDSPSTFFVVPFKNRAGLRVQGSKPSRRATRYESADIADQLRRLKADGCEIGLHGLDAWCDSELGRTEMSEICRISGDAQSGVRMHWLCFDENSPPLLEKAGFTYDSTIGYNETIGYRAGLSQVYKPLNCVRLLELPMHIMDTALFYPSYLNLARLAARKKVDQLIQNASDIGGVLTINWHDRSIAPERLWDGFYVDLLIGLRREQAWLCTAAQAVSWFKMRRMAVFSSTQQHPGQNHVKVSVNSSSVWPGLRLRVHRPLPYLARQATLRTCMHPFEDHPLQHDVEFDFSC